jgi:hypothetical protein
MVVKIVLREWLISHNAFTFILHGVLVSVGPLIVGSEVLDKSKVAIFFHDSKDGAVVPAASRLDVSKLEPLKHMNLCSERLES